MMMYLSSAPPHLMVEPLTDGAGEARKGLGSELGRRNVFTWLPRAPGIPGRE